MADDVNNKQVEQVENSAQQGNVGAEAAAAAADRFRDDLINNPNGAKLGDNSITAQPKEQGGGGKAESNLPKIDFGDKQGQGGGLKDWKDGQGQGGGLKDWKDGQGQGGGLKDWKDGQGGGGLKDWKDGQNQGGGKGSESNDHKPNSDNGNKIGLDESKIGDKLGELNKEMAEEVEGEQQEGVEQLPTGDHIVREDGKETLFTPNGDKIVLNPDGSHKIQGDVRKVETKDGVTTVTFGDGASASFDQDGFLSVTRGNQGVSFGRRSEPSFPSFPKDPGKPLEPGPKNPGKPLEPGPKYPDFPKPEPSWPHTKIDPNWQMNDNKKR